LSKLVPHYCHLTRCAPLAESPRPAGSRLISDVFLPTLTSSDGHQQTILANTLVPGDLITFTVGDRVPADVRLISAVGLEIDESALTGETRPAKKSTAVCVPQPHSHDDKDGAADHGLALSERNNIGYMGTLVRNGHGAGIVVGTGVKTEFGVIFSMMQDVEDKRTPLQIAMDELARNLSIISFAIIGVIILIGVVQKRSWLEMFTIGGTPVSLFV
jgi:Ca2+-transporting ATPase